MRFNFWIIFLVSGIFLFSCQQDKENSSGEGESIIATETFGFKDFINKFNEVKLPYYLPGSDEKKAANELEKDKINTFLQGKELQPAFGPDNMIENLADNLENSRYFSEAKISNPSGFSGLIVKKENSVNKNRFYYLFTFTPHGEFIDGMCIAYNKAGAEERTATINEDMSIHIRQNIKGEGNKASDLPSRFFELTPEGKITGIQPGI